ncbi:MULTISPECIES: hypothetical protein [unclassified Agreia]|nr:MULTISPECIES: hypothetical protein [Microbacteriaceae]
MTNEHPIPRDPGKKTAGEKEDTVLEEIEESLPTDAEPTDGPAPAA